MSKLNFTDGVSINTSGPLRTLYLKDGWYVVGRGILFPCTDEEDAVRELQAMRQDFGNGLNKEG